MVHIFSTFNHIYVLESLGKALIDENTLSCYTGFG